LSKNQNGVKVLAKAEKASVERRGIRGAKSLRGLKEGEAISREKLQDTQDSLMKSKKKI